MKKEVKILSSVVILLGLIGFTKIIGAVPSSSNLTLNIDSSDIWWLVIIGIFGFFCCLSCCLSMLMNIFRPWRYRRRGLVPPPRRHFIRWWRRAPPPGHRPPPRRRPIVIRRPPRRRGR